MTVIRKIDDGKKNSIPKSDLFKLLNTIKDSPEINDRGKRVLLRKLNSRLKTNMILDDSEIKHPIILNSNLKKEDIFSKITAGGVSMIISHRPGGGKTTFLLELAVYYSDQKKPVKFISIDGIFDVQCNKANINENIKFVHLPPKRMDLLLVEILKSENQHIIIDDCYMIKGINEYFDSQENFSLNRIFQRLYWIAKKLGKIVVLSHPSNRNHLNRKRNSPAILSDIYGGQRLANYFSNIIFV